VENHCILNSLIFLKVKAWRHVPVLRFHTLRNTSRDLDLEEERSTLPEEVEGRGVLLSCLTGEVVWQSKPRDGCS
jgi:hypothetical protein